MGPKPIQINANVLDFPSPIVEIDPLDASKQGSVLVPQNEIFRVRNIFEVHEYAIPPQYLPSGDLTIVDVGANVGLFALYMRSIRGDCDIYCFEPVPQTLKLLHKNTANQKRIHIFPYALLDREEMVDMHIHLFNSGQNTIKGDACKPGAAIRVQSKDAATQFREIGLTYIDILKIDTEGCEIEILRSLHDYLPYVGIVMAEYHSDADRRAIDTLLPNHCLFDARPYGVDLGLVKYINSRLLVTEG